MGARWVAVSLGGGVGGGCRALAGGGLGGLGGGLELGLVVRLVEHALGDVERGGRGFVGGCAGAAAAAAAASGGFSAGFTGGFLRLAWLSLGLGLGLFLALLHAGVGGECATFADGLGREGLRGNGAGAFAGDGAVAGGDLLWGHGSVCGWL